MLRERGDQVRSFSRSDHPALTALGVEQVRGNLDDLAAVREAAKGCEIVFHVAAKAGIWGRYNDFYRANVSGTLNVLEACRTNDIGRLVYTSSPSVVFDGSDVEGGNESMPYPASYEAHYPKTKALAEQMVLAANSPELATVALRPHLIWGPGDNHLVPRIIAKGRAGRLRRFVDRRRPGPPAGRRLPVSGLRPCRQGLLHLQRRTDTTVGDGQPHPGRRRDPPGDPQYLTQTCLHGRLHLRRCLGPAASA